MIHYPYYEAIWAFKWPRSCANWLFHKWYTRDPYVCYRNGERVHRHTKLSNSGIEQRMGTSKKNVKTQKQFVICERGHHEIHSDGAQLVDLITWACLKCRSKPSEYGRFVDKKNDPYDLKFWSRLNESQIQTRIAWLAEHPEDTEILFWLPGQIITHKRTGGVGVVVLCRDDYEGIEPREYFIQWVLKPELEGNERSHWLGGREQEFQLDPTYPRPC